MTGALFETAVAAEIRKLSNSSQYASAMYHWRSYSGAEVDLVLEQNGCLFPIEVKLTANPAKKDTKGLNAFRETYTDKKIAPGLVICPCQRFEKISDTDYAMPWDCE
jgi:hypothetical protein